MAKEDVPPLGPVPRKRRQLEAALDVHVAMWLASDGLTPSERRRVQEEKDRRRALAKAGAPPVVGYTGPREGMTPQQRHAVREILAELAPDEVHHGDCVGGDEAFHREAAARGARTHVHPANMPRWRAYCRGDVIEPPRPPLERNKNIAKAVDVLIATPKEESEPNDPRGHGTWSCVRYARQRGTVVTLVSPTGEVR